MCKKRLKKFLALALAATAVFSFAACGQPGGKKSVDEAKKVADEFLKDYSEFKIEDAAALFDGEIDLDMFSGVNSKEEFAKAYSKNITLTSKQKSQGVTEDFIKEQCEKITDMMDIEYEIKDTKENDDKTVEISVEVKYAKPDFDLTSSGNYAEKAAKEVGLSNESTADEIDEKMGEVYKKTFELMIEDMEDSVSEKTADGVLILKEKDGKWLIDKDNSKIDGKRFEQRLISVKNY